MALVSGRLEPTPAVRAGHTNGRPERIGSLAENAARSRSGKAWPHPQPRAPRGRFARSPPFGPRHRPPHPKRGGASRLPFHSTFRDGGAHMDPRPRRRGGGGVAAGRVRISSPSHDLSSPRAAARTASTSRPAARPPDAHRQIFCWRAWTRIAAVLCSSCPSTVGKIYEPSVLQFPLVASFRR